MTAMAGASVLAQERGQSRRALSAHPLALWSAFAGVHALLIALCLLAPGWPLGDVERVYVGWAKAATSGVEVVGITTGFVYPIVALAPILAAFAFGATWYALAWLGMVTLLNAGAFAVLMAGNHSPERKARRIGAAWWWLGFLVLLGPIALARIDSVTVPIVIIGLLLISTHPVWGTVLLTLATWIKVWPVAAIAALIVASRHRWRLAGVAAGVSALILLVTLILGGGAHVFSFVSQQTARGIQIESPVASLWMWQAVAGVPGSMVYYDRELLTYQVTGDGVEAASSLMTPILLLVLAAVLLLGWRAQRKGAAFRELFPVLVLALVLTMMAFNKVGSPQFISWLAAPVILALVVGAHAWRVPLILVTALAALTHLVYPYLYDLLLVAHPALVLALTLRNVLELVVLGWTVQRLWALPQRLNRER
jgi:Glycosyltransferase family 87